MTPSCVGAADGGESARLTSLFFALGLYCPQAFVHPAPRPPLTQAIETVEKVPFQKPTFEKWEGNTKKRLIFGAPHNILIRFWHFFSLWYEGT
jgi:hypothetical protein